MSILFLYLPLPIFWALFDQQSSRWTLQAIRMNGQLGNFTIKPDQIQVINPLLVILMIPVFEYVIYPFLTKIRLFYRPLQRMTIGGLLAAISFIICAFIQFQIEKEQPPILLKQHNHFAFVNGLQCNFNVESSFFNGDLAEFETKIFPNVPQSDLTNLIANFTTLSSDCPNGTFQLTAIINATEDQGIVMLISNKIFNNQQLYWVSFPNFLTKPDEGGAMLFSIFNIENLNINDTFSVTEMSGKIVKHIESTEDSVTFGKLDKFEVEIKGVDISISVGDKSRVYKLEQGATYIQLITGNMKVIKLFICFLFVFYFALTNNNTNNPNLQDSQLQFYLTNIVEKNKLSVFIQLIQYLVITCAEIMFSVTGLEFSYSQVILIHIKFDCLIFNMLFLIFYFVISKAPKSMKSVLQACWLLTVAFGNLIVAIIADLKIFEEQV